MSTDIEALVARRSFSLVSGSDEDGAGNPRAEPYSGLPVEGEPTTAAGQTVDERDGWPAGWLDRMFGCLADAGLERRPRAEFEERHEEEDYEPRTELGRRLWDIRKRAIAAGEAPRSREEIERELDELRKEPEDRWG